MKEERNEEALCPSLQLREWALAAGRFFQSEQTGYLHIYQGNEGQNAQTIPLFENVLFSYALLRTRLLEQVQEAKGLLKGVLAFQNRQPGRENGNFPSFLHEYPRCKDPSSALQMLAPFYWILKQFGHVLGSELKELLEAAAKAALEQCSKIHQETPFPFFLAVRLAASQLAFGKFWGQAAWTARGEELLEQLAFRQLDGWQSTRQLADLLVGLQMAFPSIENSPWNCLWKRMEQTWHSQLGAYIGPSLREWQMGVEPQTNLFSLFGGFFSGRF